MGIEPWPPTSSPSTAITAELTHSKNKINSHLTVTQLRKVFSRFRGGLLCRYAFLDTPALVDYCQICIYCCNCSHGATVPAAAHIRPPLKCSFQIFFNIIWGMLSPELLASVLTVNRAVYWHCVVSKNSYIGPNNINRHEAVARSSHWNAPRL